MILAGVVSRGQMTAIVLDRVGEWAFDSKAVLSDVTVDVHLMTVVITKLAARTDNQLVTLVPSILMLFLSLLGLLLRRYLYLEIAGQARRWSAGKA